MKRGEISQSSRDARIFVKAESIQKMLRRTRREWHECDDRKFSSRFHFLRCGIIARVTNRNAWFRARHGRARVTQSRDRVLIMPDPQTCQLYSRTPCNEVNTSSVIYDIHGLHKIEKEIILLIILYFLL